MKNHRLLFLDESGKASPKHNSKCYVLSACSVPREKLDELRINTDKIIFKYWGSKKSYLRKFHKNTIFFHARDIFRCEGPFQILRNNDIRKQFWADIYGQIFTMPYISYYMALVDKTKVHKTTSWTDKTTLGRAYKSVIEAYIKHIISLKTTGEIIAESSHDQDQVLVNILSTYQRNSFLVKRKKYNVGEIITSLSLVNKHDDEIGSQIVDLMAWTGKNKYLIDTKIKAISDLRPEEKKLLKMFESKLSSRSRRDSFHNYETILK